jgi:hypothetical protein
MTFAACRDAQQPTPRHKHTMKKTKLTQAKAGKLTLEAIEDAIATLMAAQTLMMTKTGKRKS